MHNKIKLQDNFVAIKISKFSEFSLLVCILCNFKLAQKRKSSSDETFLVRARKQTTQVPRESSNLKLNTNWEAKENISRHIICIIYKTFFTCLLLKLERRGNNKTHFCRQHFASFCTHNIICQMSFTRI